MQEGLLRAYRSFGTLRQEGGGPWIKCILVNVFRDQLRSRTDGRGGRGGPGGGLLPVSDARRARTPALFGHVASGLPQPFGNEDVREVLMRMPQIYRAPLVLRYMDGFATKEIARLLDVPLGTVLARLHRGRKRFERELWAYAQETGLC